MTIYDVSVANIAGKIMVNAKHKIVNYFYLLKKNSMLGPSYLFIGENYAVIRDIVKLIGCDKSEFFCGACWNCRRIDEANHPDVFTVEPQPLTIKIESIREAQRFLSLKSFCLNNKVVLIKDANTLSLSAANAFLKTLEEPSKNAFIAVCASHLEGLLPTIISRCRKIFLPCAGDNMDDRDVLCLRRFLEGQRMDFKDRRKFGDFLWTMALLFRDQLVSQITPASNRLLKDSLYEIITKTYSIEELEKNLENVLEIYGTHTNINENLALNLIKMNL